MRPVRIKTKNRQMRTWADREVCPDLDEPVEFNSKGVATVSADVGRAMVAAFPKTFSEVKSSAKK